MRILICTLEAPLPPPDGLRIQVGNLLEALRRRHDVRLVGFYRSEQEASRRERDATLAHGGMRLLPEPSPSTPRRLLGFLRATVTGLPASPRRLSAAMSAPLREEINGFDPDVVHLTPGDLAALAPVVRGRAAVLVPLDARYRNVEAEVLISTGIRRRVLQQHARRIRRFDGRTFGAFPRVVVVTREDAESLRALDGAIRLEVIPNGVDVARFPSASWSERDRTRLVFTGVMSYPPNIAAARFLANRVLPEVRATVHDVHLALVGRDPAPSVQALAGPGVQVTGAVPDVAPWLSGSGVFVCPMLSGTGMKNKLLEAMAGGLPCVATPLAVQGLRAVPGTDLLVGREDEIPALVLRVLRDEGLARALGLAARRYVEREHSWEEVARAYERVYEAVLAEAPSGRGVVR